METKILYFTDSHLKLKNPKYRKDNYFESVLNKMENIITIAKDKNISFIIHGGDIFDTNPNYYVLNRFIDLLELYIFKFNVIFIVGNHDRIGCSNENSCFPIIKKYFSDFFTSFYYNIVDENCIYQGYNYNNSTIYTCSYFSDLYDFKVFNNDRLKILVAHKMFVPHTVPYSYISCEEFSKTLKFDLVLCGHYHEEFDVTYNNTRFINPGALGRIDAIRYNINRVPKVVLITIPEKGKKYEIEYINVPCETDVFDIDRLQDNQSNKINTDSFINKIKNVKFFNNNIEERIKYLGNIYKEESDVVNETLRRIRNGKERIDSEN